MLNGTDADFIEPLTSFLKVPLSKTGFRFTAILFPRGITQWLPKENPGLVVPVALANERALYSSTGTTRNGPRLILAYSMGLKVPYDSSEAPFPSIH